jgi:hypothetical protein
LFTLNIADDAYRLVSKDEAQWLGQTHYYTGKPCRRGHRANRLVSTKNCTECARLMNDLNREQIKQYHRERTARLTPGQRYARGKSSRDYHARKPVAKMVFAARARAKEQGIPCDIEISDFLVPDVCPVLGIPLTRGMGKLHDGSPTLDRLVPALGYIRENVRVISHRANRIKQNASVDDLEAIARWMRATA